MGILAAVRHHRRGRAGVDLELRAAQAAYCEALLSRLAPLERAALELRELDGWDDRAITLAQGSTPGAVRTSRSKAKAKLRALVEQGELPPPNR